MRPGARSLSRLSLVIARIGGLHMATVDVLTFHRPYRDDPVTIWKRRITVFDTLL